MTRRSLIRDATFFQLGYVTGDIEAAVALWRERYGVPDFLRFDIGDPNVADGNGVRAKIALGYQGSVMIELIEPDPKNPGVYRDVLRRDGGTTLHHLGYLVDEEAFSSYPEEARHLALDVPMVHEADGMKVAYIDTRADTSLFTEIVGRTDAALGVFRNIPT